MRMNKHIIFTATALATTLVLNPALAQEAPRPSIVITSPESGEEYAGEPVELLFDVESFTFVSYKNFTTLFPGNPDRAGHAHMWIDPPPEGVSEDTVFEIESPDFHQMGELQPGRYTVTIELVRNDHSRLEPRVYDSVSFRVTETTARGKYAIIKTESESVVGEAPPQIRPLIIIFSTALVILLFWFARWFWKKRKDRKNDQKLQIDNAPHSEPSPEEPKKRFYAKLRRNRDE